MTNVKKLFSNKWLSIVEKTLDNGAKYVYSTAEWCNSGGVAILPFRRKIANDWGYTVFEFLGRYEICPAHSEKLELGAIMGGMDKEGEEPVVTAWRELIEEAGVEVPVENIIPLGTSRPSKASDNIMYLFGVDLDKGFKEVEATGDGTLLEEGGYSDWITLEELANAKEPLLQTMYVRLAQAGDLKSWS